MIAAALAIALAAATPATIDAPGFGPVALYAPDGPARRVVLLLRGADPAAADGTPQIARTLAARGALVVTVDTPAWLAAHARGPCAYPAGDLETLAQQVEKQVGLEAYLRPVVVGQRDAAAIAWAALAQAPAGTFAGAVAVEPCPDRPVPVRLCAGSGRSPRRLEGGDLPALAPAPGPLEIVSGTARAPCGDAARRLAQAIGARLTVGTADGEAVHAAVARMSAEPPAPSPAPPVSDLPLIEVPAAQRDPRLVVLLTGDGGWVGIDKALAAAFREAGVATVALDSLRYFWKRRTPDEAARDVARIVNHYATAWGRPEVLLVGYSRGADVVPFVAGRLPPDALERLRTVAMLGPGTFAEFEVHAIDLFSSVRRRAAVSTEEAVRATAGATPMLCVQGADEKDSLCPRLVDLPWVKRVVLPGGHHFGGGYRELAATVLAGAP